MKHKQGIALNLAIRENPVLYTQLLNKLAVFANKRGQMYNTNYQLNKGINWIGVG